MAASSCDFDDPLVAPTHVRVKYRSVMVSMHNCNFRLRGAARIEGRPNQIQEFAMSIAASALATTDGISQTLTLFAADPIAIAAAIFFATLLLEDATAIVVGLLASQMVVEPMPALAALLTGTIFGDVTLHVVGRYAGDTVSGQRLLTKPAVERAVRWLRARSVPTLFAARFIPGLRLPVYLGSGFLRIPFHRCLLLIVGTGLIWTPALFWVSATGGTIAAEQMGHAGLLLAPVLVVVFALKSLARHRRRTKLSHCAT